MPSLSSHTQASLGKRKRQNTAQAIAKSTPQHNDGQAESGESESPHSSPDSDDDGDETSSEDEFAARDAFRKAFEKRFAPLPGSAKSDERTHHPGANMKNVTPIVGDLRVEDDEEEEEEEDEWNGLQTDHTSSESENDSLEDEPMSSAIEVVNHSSTQADEDDAYSRRRYEARAFMSSKPPSSNTRTKRVQADDSDSDDPQTAQAQLKNDLALSRLIRESNLLQRPSSLSTTNISPKTKPTFQARQMTTESRLAALGAKTSVLEQKNVPRAIKMGMDGKKRERESKRRKEAQENGIILEKATPNKKKLDLSRRERSVGNPGVGKFIGGRLELRSNDLKKLTSRPPSDGRRRGKR